MILTVRSRLIVVLASAIVQLSSLPYSSAHPVDETPEGISEQKKEPEREPTKKQSASAAIDPAQQMGFVGPPPPADLDAQPLNAGRAESEPRSAIDTRDAQEPVRPGPARAGGQKPAQEDSILGALFIGLLGFPWKAVPELMGCALMLLVVLALFRLRGAFEPTSQLQPLEPARLEPVRLEPARLESARPTPARPAAARPEPARLEPARLAAARPGPVARPVTTLPATGMTTSPVSGAGWKVVATSVAGTSHQRTGQPCQDASYWRVIEGRMLVGAVADGAGSAKYSDQGAHTAVRMAVETLMGGARELGHSVTGQQWQRLLHAAITVAKGHIESKAAVQDVPVREFATTLLLFVATPRAIFAAQVGDGAIVVRAPSGELKSLTVPQNGEYANTTCFLVSPDSLSNVQNGVWEGQYAGIAAFTDGLQRLALVMPSGNPHGPFFAPLFDFADRADNLGDATEELGSFLRSTKVTSRADDDLTLMLAKVSIA